MPDLTSEKEELVGPDRLVLGMMEIYARDLGKKNTVRTETVNKG